MTTAYAEFVARKQLRVERRGIAGAVELSAQLFPFQLYCAREALRRGCAALFLECGLGKSWIALEWARVVAERTGRPVLILTPLAVAQQFVREGAKLGIQVFHARCPVGELRHGIYVCNYESLHHWEAFISLLGGIVLDESSILKAFDGKTRTQLIETFRATPFKLCCTATPSPNDTTELGNHAEFLGVMRRVDMLSRFFEHDGGDTSKWTLKGHARRHFWQWVGQWAICARKPSDLGFDDAGYDLPELRVHEHVVDVDRGAARQAGLLFGYEAATLTEQRAVRRSSLSERVQLAADIVNADTEQWALWPELNDESRELTKAIPGAIEVTGSDAPEQKEHAIMAWLDGLYRVLVTKSSIAGFGVNMQNCARQLFPGVGHSYESWHQTVRRSWRFGQRRPVDAHMVRTSADGMIVANLRRKQAEAEEMARQMAEVMRANQG